MAVKVTQPSLRLLRHCRVMKYTRRCLLWWYLDTVTCCDPDSVYSLQ
jgi:hypothetical protein